MRQLIIYNNRGFTLFDCYIACDDCPLRFRCLTTNKIVMIHGSQWIDFNTIVAGYEYRGIVKFGHGIAEELAYDVGEYY